MPSGKVSLEDAVIDFLQDGPKTRAQMDWVFLKDPDLLREMAEDGIITISLDGVFALTARRA